MSGQKGFWDVEERLAELSAEGDLSEKRSATLISRFSGQSFSFSRKGWSEEIILWHLS
jgi:hypothetical protein